MKKIVRSYGDAGSLGMTTPIILVMMAVFFVFATSIMSWSVSERKDTLKKVRGTQALQVAETGVDYYKWHLNHDNEDFQDGHDWCCDNDSGKTVEQCGGVCGPYSQVYKDYNGESIGEFSLSIVPPSSGSTIFQLESTGYTYEDPAIHKTVRVRLGKMSLARFSFLSDAPIWIGEGEATVGPLHSNGGIRFDGTCNAEVSSAVEEYNGNSANHGFTGVKPGIWGSDDPDVQKFWSFPEPEIDFDLFTLDMANIKSNAQSGGIYLPDNGLEGYKIIFKSNATIDVYNVKKRSQKVKFFDPETGYETEDWEGANQEVFKANYPMPSNGVMFVEDNVWVEGVVNGRMTLAVSNFEEDPVDYARIIINNNISYLTLNGSNVLGLMAEGDILVPRHAPQNLTINAVMLSQKSHVYRRIYKSSYSVVNGSVTVYGGVITNLFWTWSWIDNHGNTTDGYRYTNTIYDNNLTFSPPPYFPTEENFEVISWEEK
jgi:hypothetical protein